MSNEFIIRNGFIAKDGSLVEGNFTATTISAATYYNLPAGGGGGGGASGISGLSGISGISGISGLSGQIGPSGGVSGISGLSGISGQVGSQGPQGPQGPAGSNGTTPCGFANMLSQIISYDTVNGGVKVDFEACNDFGNIFSWNQIANGHYRLDSGTNNVFIAGCTFIDWTIGVDSGLVDPTKGASFYYRWRDSDSIDFYTFDHNNNALANFMFYGSLRITVLC